MIANENALQAAKRLYSHLERTHVRHDGALIGPDPGVSLNLRLTRFIKSYLRFLPWRDNLYYLQAQAYWIIDNLELYRLTGQQSYRSQALRCADVVAARQNTEGFWTYPQAEWKTRVATVEGCFGALALLEAYSIDKQDAYLKSARLWYSFMTDRIGFQEDGLGGRAVNYFNNVPRGMVPNNSTLALWFAAALARATGDQRYTEHCDGLISFLAHVQKKNGELPYVVESSQGPGREHYLCFQYNAYQFLDLAEYLLIISDDDQRVKSIMSGLAKFLSNGLTGQGDARHDCVRDRPTMHYFTSAVAAALAHATFIGLGDYSSTAAKALERLLVVQNANGGYDYSWGDYGFLTDRRSYPRNQAMILRHLLILAQGGKLRTMA